MQVTYAKALALSEINPDLQDIVIEGKSWFYVELDTGDGFDLLASDIEEAKRYAVATTQLFNNLGENSLPTNEGVSPCQQ